MQTEEDKNNFKAYLEDVKAGKTNLSFREWLQNRKETGRFVIFAIIAIYFSLWMTYWLTYYITMIWEKIYDNIKRPLNPQISYSKAILFSFLFVFISAILIQSTKSKLILVPALALLGIGNWYLLSAFVRISPTIRPLFSLSRPK